jgi:hypothetical protein
MVSRPSFDVAVVRIEGAPEGAPDTMDVRCVRLSLSWPTDAPLCCARGAAIDLRAKMELIRVRPDLPWSNEGPQIDGVAKSGVIDRLADRAVGERSACGALDPAIDGGGVRGDGCSIRSAARSAGHREDVWLLDGCALFPLDVVDGSLVPSPRIPDDALVAAADDGGSLWDDARARVALRFGEDFAEGIDRAVTSVRARRSRGLHLKTLK